MVPHDGSHAFTTEVHEGLRLDEQHTGAGSQLAFARLIELPFSPETARQAIQHHETHIVAGFGIVATGITQPHDNTDRRHGIDD